MNMSAIEQLDWDNVRVFLATMRASSLRRAARTLGVSRPTAGRHLSALEAQLNLKLFERRSDGLHATPEAMKLVGPAEDVERAMLALGRTAQAANPELSGIVRVTLPAIVASELLMPDFVAFCRRWPQIDLRIDSNYEVTSLADRKADVAIRFMPHGKAPEVTLTGRLAATAYTAVYGHGDCWIGARGGAEDHGWIRDSPFPDLPVRGAMFDGALQRSACAAGWGLAQLPCFFAEPTLTRRTQPKPGFDIWVLVHSDLRQNPRLRVFRDEVVDALRRHRPRLKGAPV